MHRKCGRTKAVESVIANRSLDELCATSWLLPSSIAAFNSSLTNWRRGTFVVMYLSLSLYLEGLGWMFDSIEIAERRAQLEYP